MVEKAPRAEPACKGMRHVTLTCELIHSVTIATTNATPRVAVATPPRKKGE